MEFIYPKCTIMTNLNDDILKKIESAGRTCYKSEEKITKESYTKFVNGLIRSGHESVIEHSSITVRFIMDRGISHELVRHRLCAFSQESTRYCTYDKHMKFIIPLWCENIKEGIYDTALEMKHKLNLQECEHEFVCHLEDTEESYQRLLKYDWLAEEARSVLPNCLKTEIVTTTNIREWRHILSLRTSKGAHPQIKEIMFPLLEEFAKVLPVVFDTVYQIRKEDKFFKNKKFNTIIEYDKTI